MHFVMTITPVSFPRGIRVNVKGMETTVIQLKSGQVQCSRHKKLMTIYGHEFDRSWDHYAIKIMLTGIECECWVRLVLSQEKGQGLSLEMEQEVW